MKTFAAAIALLFTVPFLASAQPTNSFPLWPNGAPGALGTTDKDIPTLMAYLPSPDSATGAAMVICPGGGYGGLAHHEGEDYARFLNESGIAGFVLTMGIGVDSNVLIFERIKEELEAQRGVRASINAGFGRVFWTLFDTHIAALISVAFLFQFGTGPIRGFAVTLFFGLISNLFTSIFVSKTLFELVLGNRPQPQAASLSI